MELSRKELPLTDMEWRKVLLVTNDFPPTLGGIQSYLRDYAACIPPENLVVMCSTQDAQAAADYDAHQDYEIVRLKQKVLLPTPSVAQQLRDIIRSKKIEVVWFGAAAPLALLAPQARAAGAIKIIASTHGHEVGWSMLPGARQVLRYIGTQVDCVTYVSRYARSRIAAALGSSVPLEALPSGVDSFHYRPRPEEAASLRQKYHISEGSPVVVCISRIVPRKGQDMLVESWSRVLEHEPEAYLVIVGPGRGSVKLQKRAQALKIDHRVCITGSVEYEELPAHFSLGDIFALPVRTQAGGLSVEGLGIVYLEAQAAGVATIAGSGGGAPETIIPNETGMIVDGRSVDDISQRILTLLQDPSLREKMSRRGREVVEKAWNWQLLGHQLHWVMSDDYTGTDARPIRHSWTYR